MRIAVLTYHRAYNCGAALQAWALQCALERLGHKVEMPTCNNVGVTPRWQFPWVNPERRGVVRLLSLIGHVLINLRSVPMEDVRIHRYRKFRKDFLHECDCRPEDFARLYDAVVVGSDQVWNERLSGDDASMFFAENIPEAVRKIAYAASCGDEPLGGEQMERLVAGAMRFDAVSVREDRTARQLECRLGKKVPVTLDPTLLLEQSDYDAVASSDFPREPYLFMYTISKAPFVFQTARDLSKRLGVRCVIAPCYQYGLHDAEKGIVFSMSPDRLVSYTKNARYVVADSFHGTALGVLFGKPTIALRDHVDHEESRVASLLNSLGMGVRLANPETTIDRMEMLLKSGIPETAMQNLTRLRTESIGWLKAQLTNCGRECDPQAAIAFL